MEQLDPERGGGVVDGALARGEHAAAHLEGAPGMAWRREMQMYKSKWAQSVGFEKKKIKVKKMKKKNNPVKASILETKRPRLFMSIASSSMAPTPALSIVWQKAVNESKGVPAPHMPSRVM